MNKEQSNMDNLLRDKLGNHQVEPPAHVWKGVQGQMNALRRKKIIAFYSRVAAAAVVVLAFLAGWYFNGQNQNEKPGMVQNESVRKQPSQNVPALNNHADDTLKKEQDVSAEDVKPLLAENNPVNQEAPSKSFETNDNQISSNQHKPLNQITLRQDDNLNGAETGLPKLENIEAEMVYTKELTLTKIEKPKEAGPVLTTEDKLLIASNSRTTKENRAEKSGWKMGLTVSPGYSSFESGHSGNYAQNMTYQSKEGIANVGGGVSVQYKTGKKWRVESGVYYAQNGQKSGNSNNLFAFDNNEVLDYAPQLSAGNAYFNTAVRVAGNQIAMNSTAGVIEFDKLPAGAV
ncbi:MAG TPA: hypothetical protein VKA10_11015, partial [Prolixibacteraceae bacterium]|nr:hypothetical protein [Prolixibacteraceae bacterium]